MSQGPSSVMSIHTPTHIHGPADGLDDGPDGPEHRGRPDDTVDQPHPS